MLTPRRKGRKEILMLVLALALLVGGSSSPLFAQCSMCYQNAAAQGAKGIRALNLGIVILLVPPLAIAACITRVAYRHRDSRPPE